MDLLVNMLDPEGKEKGASGSVVPLLQCTSQTAVGSEQVSCFRPAVHYTRTHSRTRARTHNIHNTHNTHTHTRTNEAHARTQRTQRTHAYILMTHTHEQVGAHESSEAVLLDLKNAPTESFLASVARTFVRLDNLAHVLAWAVLPAGEEAFKPLDPSVVTQSDLSFVVLPRLKLTFAVRTVGGVPRLYSLDHSDFYITNERTDTAVELLRGIPHSLLLSNANSELQVLVPSFPPARPSVATRPFSTELVLVREDRSWRSCLDQPYFMYPVHISLSFLYSTTLASALYLLLLRFLNRDYQKCAELVDTISSDVELTEEENQTLQFFASDLNSTDNHPDAHACRLKISLVLMDSPISVPWDLTVCMQRYITKLAHVSANCRLSHDEELMLLKHCVCDPADANFQPEVHTVYQALVNKNRRSMLRAQAAGKQQCAVELPPTPPSRPWMYEWDNAGLDSSDGAVDALLEGCEMAGYRYNR